MHFEMVWACAQIGSNVGWKMICCEYAKKKKKKCMRGIQRKTGEKVVRVGMEICIWVFLFLMNHDSFVISWCFFCGMFLYFVFLTFWFACLSVYYLVFINDTYHSKKYSEMSCYAVEYLSIWLKLGWSDSRVYKVNPWYMSQGF